MDSIIFSAANLEVHVRETILQALPPEKTIFKKIDKFKSVCWQFPLPETLKSLRKRRQNKKERSENGEQLWI
ncbi:hypothetical protein [Chordicoccus furentiruminis]|uniref:hypothetical protein n=1 Tax=Chordicoccus furentiruminis TaxID=2709410 RepID=UPI0023A7C57B|nr:hypothetical protein [Chordicoccus furentiruminis]